MQLYDPSKLGAPTGGIFNPKEKKRVAMLVVGAVVLIGAVVTVKSQGDQRASNQLASMQAKKQEPLPTEIAVPKIDVAALEAAASDELPEQRVILPSAALEAGFKTSGQIFDGVYAALGGRELTASIAAEILADPKGQRGKLLRARCFVDDLRDLPNPSAEDRPRFFVRGHLEDGTDLFFAVEEFVGTVPVPGEFVRMDGLFVRVHREEVDGRWREGPLLIGPRMYESFPVLAPVTELDPGALARVRDDSVKHGLDGLDSDTYWQLVSYVKGLDASKVDWSQATLLDQPTMAAIFEDGNAWRGKPVRLSEARMLNVWKQAQAENPLRMERMYEGWFSRGDWRLPVLVSRFVTPSELPPTVHKSMEVNLRAFFYKNLAYTKADGGMAIAPFFVVHSVEPYVRPDYPGLRHMTYIVAGTLLVLGIGIVIVLRHDKASSQKLEDELLRRRRERRGKLAPAAKT